MASRTTALIGLPALVACAVDTGGGGPQAGAPPVAEVSPDAPAWARGGDNATAEGLLLVCEGEGGNPAAARDAAMAICNAKICARCGVEIQAITETTETLRGVEMRRTVVERCRRVRKGADKIVAQQSSCQHEACRSWLQILFSKEAEARECKAYADEHYADPEECERLVTAFREVPRLTAASFAQRVELLDAAIIACAEIDVRPTPRIETLNEVLWQGVLSPRAQRAELERPVDAAPVAEQVAIHNRRKVEDWRVRFAERFYRPIDRQQLIETKILVDRIAIVRDLMADRLLVFRAIEAAAPFAGFPESDPATLVAALRAAPRSATYGTPIPHYAILFELRGGAQLQEPIREAMADLFPVAERSRSQQDTMLSFYIRDEEVTEEEWNEAMTPAGLVSYETLLAVRNHGGASRREARFIAAAERCRAGGACLRRIIAAAELEFAVEIYARLPDWLQAAHTWEVWQNKTTADRRERKGTTWKRARDQALRWMAKGLADEVSGDRIEETCRSLDRRLAVLETSGVDTRSFEDAVCTCLAQPKSAPNTLAGKGLYRRFNAWGLRCNKEKRKRRERS